MKYKISPIHKSDIPDIRKLYQEVYPRQPHLIKDTKELEWLFKDPHQKNGMLGYIARTPGQEPAGVVGYSLNQYKFGSRELKGVIPVSWMVSPAHRGLLGIQLLKKVMNEGDFGFAIQGSTVAQQAYKAVRMRYIDSANVYTKVLRPFAYIRSGAVSPRKQSRKQATSWGVIKTLPAKKWCAWSPARAVRASTIHRLNTRP